MTRPTKGSQDAGWREQLHLATQLALDGRDTEFESEKLRMIADYTARLKAAGTPLKGVEEWLKKSAEQLRAEHMARIVDQAGKALDPGAGGSQTIAGDEDPDSSPTSPGPKQPTPPRPAWTAPNPGGRVPAPALHVYPPQAQLPAGIRRRPGVSQSVAQMIESICTALMIPEEAPPVPGVWDWAAVLAEIGDYVASQDFMEEQKERFEYQGFDAKLVAKAMSAAGDSGLYKGEAAVFRERMTLVIIALMRGAKLDKVRKGMNPDVLGTFDTLVRNYHIQSKPILSTTITLPRIIAVHPALAWDVLKVLELGPVKHATMTALVPNYPRHVMFSAFPALVPRSVPGVTEVLISGYLLYQHQVSLVINKEYPKWDTARQKASIETFAQAALASEYTNQRQRVAFMVKEGWLHKVDSQNVSLTDAVGVVALKQAAAAYEVRR